MFFPTTWLDQPFIKVKGNKVHELLGSDAKYVSYDDFFANGTYEFQFTTMSISEKGTWIYADGKLSVTTAAGKEYVAELTK